LLDRGFRLIVWDRDADSSSRFASGGAEMVRRAADLAKRAGVVVCALETGAEVEAALGGTDGFVEAASDGDVIICLSTIDPAVLRRINAMAAPLGVDIVDTPLTSELSGNRPVLRAYAGGNAPALERVRPLLSVLADEVVYCGALGNGLAMKHIVNMLAQVQRVLIVEALALGRKAGLDLEQMVHTISGSKGNSIAFQRLASRILSQDFEGVPMRVTCEDVAIQAQMANSLDMPVNMTSAALQVYKTGVSMGLGDLDAAALTKVYELCTGVVLHLD
jgi:3-hydroxyisobutyrate dehydrogenase-like beta-hydroxyacid dehydrogenase